jgi:hypothetical protein
MDAYSSLLTAFCHQLFTLLSCRSFSALSNHLNLGLPLLLLLLLPACLLWSTYITVLPWSFLTVCPIYSSLFFLIFAAICRFFYSSHNSWILFILHVPCSTTGPWILLNISLFRVPSLLISISVMAHVSFPYTVTGYDIFVNCNWLVTPWQ